MGMIEATLHKVFQVRLSRGTLCKTPLIVPIIPFGLLHGYGQPPRMPHKRRRQPRLTPGPCPERPLPQRPKPTAKISSTGTIGRMHQERRTGSGLTPRTPRTRTLKKIRESRRILVDKNHLVG